MSPRPAGTLGLVELKSPESPNLWPWSEMTVRLTAVFGTLDSDELAPIAIAEPDVERARQDSNL
jgi:hypothetical protein